MDTLHLLNTAKRTLELEAQSVSALQQYINEDFLRAVQAVFESRGRLIVSGVGKSAIIAQKIVATLNSTGTPGLYMHAADAIHGDLGMVTPGDIVMIISKSGNSAEIKVLVTLIRNFGNTLIAMVGNVPSFLANQADIVLNTTVSMEACPNNLAPTSSTTAQMVMGDALAVCLMEARGFSGDDFAKFHPGGILGKKLYLRVNDLYTENEQPKVGPEQTLREVIVEMTARRLGVTAVVGDHNELLGIITDGDLRRMLEKDVSLNEVRAKDIMTVRPKTIESGELAVEALLRLQEHGISQLAVTSNNEYLGIIHLHDLLKEGLL